MEASAFADWVFKKNNPNWKPKNKKKAAHLREFGEYSHELIEELKLWCVDKGLKAEISEWIVAFVDRKDRNANDTFRAGRLIFDGKPLVCRPDLVLKHPPSRQILIVERKTHLVRSPSGWKDKSYQNIWAQLWCYSWIDEWADYNALLVSELWNFDRFDYKVVREMHHRSEIDSEMRMLFTEFGGMFQDR